jgi:hypothetical protein
LDVANCPAASWWPSFGHDAEKKYGLQPLPEMDVGVELGAT